VKQLSIFGRGRRNRFGNSQTLCFLGTLQYLGLHINAITSICLIISIGLLVDFVVHVLWVSSALIFLTLCELKIGLARSTEFCSFLTRFPDTSDTMNLLKKPEMEKYEIPLRLWEPPSW
jgi:hypothetical protein